VVICPCCQSRTVRIIAAGSGFCTDCGHVNLGLQDLQRLSPDGDWLRRRIAQALDLASAQAQITLPGRVWRIGDIGQANDRHRVLYGQQLADVRVLRDLLTVWPTHIGAIPAILITTSPIDRVFLPGVPVQVVPLTTAFHLRGGGLVADEAVWAGMRAARRPPAIHTRIGPFAHDFSDVLLPGESEPIPLTRSQAAILRVLWEQAGVSIGGPSLLRRAGLAFEKPIDAFPLNKYPDANRAYRLLVQSDRRRRYWLPRAPSVVTDDPA
jgi:hypothetical protein